MRKSLYNGFWVGEKAAAAGHTNWAEFKAACVAVPSLPIQLQEKKDRL